MQARRHSEESEEHGIDLAPMLDFTVNLLIFFIITTSFVKQAGQKVVEPEAVTAQQRDSANLQIAIEPDGQVWMDRKPIQMRDLQAAIERLHIERPDDTVIILADKASKAGVVAKVMDAVRAGGVKFVSIAAAPAGQG